MTLPHVGFVRHFEIEEPKSFWFGVDVVGRAIEYLPNIRTTLRATHEAGWRDLTVLALRARIILLAADGIGNRESARRLRGTVQTVRCWRRRWDGEPDLALIDRLADAPRPGTPLT